MPKQGPGGASTKSLYSGSPVSTGEIAAYAGVTLFALALVAAERWRIPLATDSTLSLLALLSLLASTALWIRRPVGGAMLATFLPALPLAAAVLAVEGESAGGKAFTATALAFQLRCLLLAASERRRRQRDALADALSSRLPGTVTVFVDNDIETEVKIDGLRDGHIFRVAPGQIVPADGLVTFGSGFVDEALLPGEAEAMRMKGMGSMVYAGSLNKNGNLLVRATAVGSQAFASRLAARIRSGTETSALRLLAADGVLGALAVGLLALSGPMAALGAFLAASGASVLAVLGSFELGLAAAACSRLWLWSPGGLRRLSETGMLVLRAEGVLSEGRPKLVAIESASKLSEDAVLGLMAPLARRLETPAAFAVLQELRQRNIPLQPVEFYQPHEDGAAGLVCNDDVRWKSLPRPGAGEAELGALGPFVREHLAAGEEVHLLERDGRPEAALAFRDPPVPRAAESVEELRALSLPVLLVSELPRRAIDRLRTELGLEHAQGETSPADADLLMNRLSEEGLSPAWVQTGPVRPARCSALISLPLPGENADLTAPQVSLPSLAGALSFARHASRRLRFSVFFLFSAQTGLLISLLGADARVAALLKLGNGWPLSGGALAIAGALPGFIALFWVCPACQRTQAANAKLEAENV